MRLSFPRPAGSWLEPAAWALMATEHDAACGLAERGDPAGLVEAQNRAMLAQFFLEQVSGPAQAGPLTQQVIARDWPSAVDFEREWQALAEIPQVQWIVFGLGFLDFKFHLYAVQAVPPFCVSPVLCWALGQELVSRSGMTRAQYAQQLLAHTDWSVGELRLQCLEQPVDIFGEPQHCVSGSCNAVVSKESVHDATALRAEVQ